MKLKTTILILYLAQAAVTVFGQTDAYRCDNVTKTTGAKGTLYLVLSGVDYDIGYNSVAIKWKAYTSQASVKSRENASGLQLYLLDAQAKDFLARAGGSTVAVGMKDAAIWAGNAYGFIPDHTNLVTGGDGKQIRYAVIKSLNDLSCSPVRIQ